MLSVAKTIVADLETTFGRLVNRPKKWRMVELFCSIPTVYLLPIESLSAGITLT